MTCATFETTLISALRKSSEPEVRSDIPDRNHIKILNRSRLKLLLMTMCSMATICCMAVAKADNDSLSARSLSAREIAVLDSVTCGYVAGRWIPGSVSRDGYFTPLQNQISKAARQLKNAKARGATSAKVNRCNRRLQSLRKSQKRQILTCRTIGTEPDNFGTPTYSPTPFSPTPAATSAGAQTPDSPTATPRPTRTPTSTPDDSATATPRPTRTPTPIPDETGTATPRPTRTPSATNTPAETVAIRISLVDPCSNGPVSGFDPIADGAAIDLQEVPANANVLARLEPNDQTKVKSVRMRLGSWLDRKINLPNPLVAFKAPILEPASPYTPLAGDIYPGALRKGTYYIRATAYGDLDGKGPELGSTQIMVNISDTNILSANELRYYDYTVPNSGPLTRIYTPQETKSGCTRAGVSDGSQVFVVDISNHDVTSGVELPLNPVATWPNAKVGIGYHGEVAVVNQDLTTTAEGYEIPTPDRFNYGFYEPDLNWSFGGAYIGLPLDSIDILREPAFSLDYLFLTGIGSNPGVATFLVDFKHRQIADTLHRLVYRGSDIQDGGGTFPLPDNSGGLYVIGTGNWACDPGIVFHVPESNLSAYTVSDAAIAPPPSTDQGGESCIETFKATVFNGDLFVAASGHTRVYNETDQTWPTTPYLVLTRYGIASDNITPSVKSTTGLSLPYREGLKGVTVLEDGTMAVLFHEYSPSGLPVPPPSTIKHTIMFYDPTSSTYKETGIQLPFAASGIKAVTGGKLVLYGPSDSTEQLTSGQAHIAVVY